jgi:hypothetical protein
VPNITKAYAISDAKISFVSLVDKAANKKQFIIKKADDGSATFTSYGRILKADIEKHYVTGIVYEPMVEDTQGNYMTEDEIVKAAHWYMKNQGSVDIQHCFEKADGVEVVESYVTKCDMELEGEPIKKGTWIMTAEVTDSDVWDSIQKGEITGFSMGGCGVYSDIDVDLDTVEKDAEPKGLLRKLAKAMGLDVVEKGAVKTNFQRRVKEDNFYSAWYALRSTLEGNFYNPDTGGWEWGYNSDENTIKEALADFNDIVTQLLTSDGSIVKSLEKAAQEAPQEIMKAGRSISSKNLQTLQGINNSLSEFLSAFTAQEDEGDSSNTDTQNITKKEDDEMNKEEVQKMVSEEIQKAMGPITQKLDAIAKGDGDGEPSAGGTELTDGSTGAEVTAESVSKMVGEEVQKAMEPIAQKLDAIAKSRALPGNLNDDAGAGVAKSGEQHYMAGMF